MTFKGRDRSMMWLYGRNPLKVSHHPAKFCSHRHYGGADTMILFCHVILKDHMIKWS